MTDVDIENQLRRGLADYAEAIVVTAPPVDEIVHGPAAHHRRRHQMVLAGMGVAAVAATVVGVGVVLTRDDPHDVSTSPPGETVSEGCGAQQGRGDTLTGGRLPDGRPWTVEVRGTPPLVGTWEIVAGEEVGGVEHNVWSWAELVNRGALSWQLDVFEDGQLLVGEVPPSTSRVDVRLDGGRTITLCPISLPGIDVVRYAATALPEGPDIVEIAVVDRAGRTIALGDVATLLPSPLDRGGYGFGIQVDDELVELPLGGTAAADPSSTPMEAVIHGELPSGPWSLRTGVVESPGQPHHVVELVPPDPVDRMTIAATVDDFLRHLEWQLTVTDGRLIVWGVTPTAVAEITVTLDDDAGPPVSIPTQPSGTTGFDVRLFAQALPEGALPTAIEGRDAGGTAVVRAEDLAEQITPIRNLPPNQTIAIAIDPAP